MNEQRCTCSCWLMGKRPVQGEPSGKPSPGVIPASNVPTPDPKQLDKAIHEAHITGTKHMMTCKEAEADYSKRRMLCGSNHRYIKRDGSEVQLAYVCYVTHGSSATPTCLLCAEALLKYDSKDIL